MKQYTAYWLHAEGQEGCNLTLPYCLEMSVDNWSALDSGCFISDVACTKVHRSLNITAIIIIIY